MIEAVRDSCMAEQAVIGCILADKRAMPLAAEELTEEDFSLSDCRTVFEAAKKIFLRQKPIDAVTVLGEIGGGDEWKVHLVKLVEAAQVMGNLPEYISIVKEGSLRRNATRIAAELQADLLEGEPLEACQEKASTLAQGMTRTTGECLSAVEGFDLVFGQLGRERRYIRTGFADLDRYVMFGRGDYMVVGGKPSAGKTAFSLQLALNMAKECAVAYFSLETSAQKVYERLLSCFAGSPFEQINRGKVDDPARLFEAREGFSKLHLHVVNAAGWTVTQIRAKAVQLRAQVVMVDYIGLVRSPGKSLYERVTNTSMDLHTMAQQSKMAVVALSQLNREGAKKKDEDPDMSDLRESGQIEQDADCILLLKAKNERRQETERKLIIAKNKTGRTGAMRLNFEGEYQRFTEVADRWPPE